MNLARAFEKKLQSIEGKPHIYSEATSRQTQNIVGIQKGTRPNSSAEFEEQAQPPTFIKRLNRVEMAERRATGLLQLR
ncbi:hypothetical protein GOBAR_DD07493 [Gossypium barbadense]|nr:hypothetical protein GOBAR_DD07493 [Gossypium barbadense]